MFSALLVAALVQAPPAQAAPRPPSLVIFGRERWYQEVRGDEEPFVGILERLPGAVRGSRTAYRLVMHVEGRPVAREVFIGPDPNVLAPYVGQRVTLTGTAVDLKVEGKMRYEIWPARLDVGGAAAPVPATQVLARAPWNMKDRGVIKVGVGQQQLVIRGNQELLAVAGGPAEARAMLQALGVPAVDWKTQMLLLVAAGVQPNKSHTLEVTSIEDRDKTLVVGWRLNRPGPKEAIIAGFANPAQLVLVPRFDGPVKFEPSR